MDVVEAVSEMGDYQLEKTLVVLSGSGGPIDVVGGVVLPESLLSSALIGDPLLDVANTTLNLEGSVMKPHVERTHAQHLSEVRRESFEVQARGKQTFAQHVRQKITGLH